MRGSRRPQKLRHRPSDELIDIRERGRPWLLSVFVLLLFLLTILLIYFFFTTRTIYLSQRDLVGTVEVKQEKIEEELKITNRSALKDVDEDFSDVHVDIVPIVNRKTGEPDESKVIEVVTTLTSTSSSTTTTTEEPTTTTATTTTSTSTSTTTTTTAEEPSATNNEDLVDGQDSEGVEEDIDYEREDVKEPTEETLPTKIIDLRSSIEEIEDSIDDVEVDEYVEVSTTTTTTITTTTTTTTEQPTSTATTITTTSEIPTKISQNAEDEIKWDRKIRSQKTTFESFGISTQHEECSKIGKKISESGGNAIDAMIAAEICISAIHPHSTGPGFGGILVVHSKKKNGTYLIDGREKAPKNANQNTFVINPTIAHIGYSSMGVPGWVSVLWSAYKQFGSGKIEWKFLVEPTLDLMKKGIHIDRLLRNAFESRKNHILHEKSFGTLFNQTTREGGELNNENYFQFLEILANSSNAENDFYRGQIASNMVDEMKSRGGLISRHDFESYASIVTRAELIPIMDQQFYLAGPHLPYHFPILSKIFNELTAKYQSKNPEGSLEYYSDYVKLLQKANQMKMFVGDDHFEPEVKLKIDEWQMPNDFKPEEQVDENSRKRNVQSFSRIVAMDNEGNAVNFMSTNNVPFGSVRRSQYFGFVWNNAMSSFDVFCRHSVNCVQGGKRPSISNILPSILLNSEKLPLAIISPTTSSLAITSSLILQSTLMNLTLPLSLDTPRIYPISTDQVFVEPTIPQQLYRHLWLTFRAQFSHPSHDVTLLQKFNGKIEIFCDFRQTTKTCFPIGL